MSAQQAQEDAVKRFEAAEIALSSAVAAYQGSLHLEEKGQSVDDTPVESTNDCAVDTDDATEITIESSGTTPAAVNVVESDENAE